MPVLALDTAGRLRSVALVSKGNLISERSDGEGSSASATILDMVEEVLSGAGLSASDLSAVAVTSGPGAFTGLRVGMATAKGLALSLQIPLAGVSTLRALAEALAAEAAAPVGTSVCGLLSAGRGQVYRGIYTVGALRGKRRAVAPDGQESLRDLGEALEGLPSGSLIGGDIGALQDRLSLPPGASTVAAGDLPLAPAVAWIAEEIEAAGLLQGRAITPNYVREGEYRAPRAP